MEPKVEPKVEPKAEPKEEPKLEIESTEEPTQFICPDCKKSFASQKGLTMHKVRVHKKSS